MATNVRIHVNVQAANRWTVLNVSRHFQSAIHIDRTSSWNTAAFHRVSSIVVSHVLSVRYAVNSFALKLPRYCVFPVTRCSALYKAEIPDTRSFVCFAKYSPLWKASVRFKCKDSLMLQFDDFIRSARWGGNFCLILAQQFGNFLHLHFNSSVTKWHFANYVHRAGRKLGPSGIFQVFGMTWKNVTILVNHICMDAEYLKLIECVRRLNNCTVHWKW